MTPNNTNHKKQFSLFAVVGIFNTILDFSIFNSLIFAASFQPVLANLISASIAMCISFYLNRRFVFNSQHKKVARQFMLFVLITSVGLYVIQTGIIALLAAESFTFFDPLYRSVSEGLTIFGDNFLKNNTAKIVATAASMIWNYFLYHKYVFGRKIDEK